MPNYRTNAVTGTVKNKKGGQLHFFFVGPETPLQRTSLSPLIAELGVFLAFRPAASFVAFILSDFFGLGWEGIHFEWVLFSQFLLINVILNYGCCFGKCGLKAWRGIQWFKEN